MPLALASSTDAVGILGMALVFGHIGVVTPSERLLPFSYAAMLRGTPTLIATSTDRLANDLSWELLDHPIGTFEFTLGLAVLFGCKPVAPDGHPIASLMNQAQLVTCW